MPRIKSGIASAGTASLKTADYTVVASDNGKIIPIQTTMSYLLVQLPSLSSVFIGFSVVIKDNDGQAATRTITVQPDSGDTIDGTLTDGPDYISANYQAVAYVSVGTMWNRAVVASANSTGTRAVAAGGRTGGAYTDVNTMDYVTMSTLSNATSFGTISSIREDMGSLSNHIRGIVTAGQNNTFTPTSILEYITIPTTGNMTNFGR